MHESTLLEHLNRQLRRASGYSLYRTLWGRDHLSIGTLAEFAQVPTVPRGTFAKDTLETDPPRGSFFNRDVARINLTPSAGGLRPVYFSRNDLAVMRRANAELLCRAGVSEDDVAITTLSYSLLPGGLMLQDAFEELGAKIIPVGPGDTERTVELMKRWQVTVLCGNPSFAVKLAQAGAPPIRLLLAGGEPLSAVPGYKDAVRSALGPDVILIESYGMAETGPMARECRHQAGLHIAKGFVHLEILNPDSEHPVPEGEVGEIVVTQLDKEVMPLVRYRTGDLSAMGHVPCACGRTLTLLGGIRGRADQMRKVKGVKVYADQVRAILERLPATKGRAFRLQLKPASVDTPTVFTLMLEGPPLAGPDVELLRGLFRQEILVVPDHISTRCAPSTEPVWMT